MKALLFHAKNYKVEFESLANRPENIIHEKIEGKEKQEVQNCVTCFITIEEKDSREIVVENISNEIQKMCKEVGENTAIIIPFAHLSNKLAEPKIGYEIIKEIESNLKGKLNVTSAHFGSNKSLLLDIYGHAGNVRYREF